MASVSSTPGANPGARAWTVAAALLVMLAVGNGLTLAGLSVFDDTLLKALDVSIGALKFRDLLGLVCSGASAPIIGYAADRYGVRPVIALGLLLIAVAMALYAQVHRHLARLSAPHPAGRGVRVDEHRRHHDAAPPGGFRGAAA